jgi:TP901 family phage tail tape measure protein
MAEDDQTSILKVLVQLRDEATEPLKKVSESFEQFSDSLHGIWYSALEIGAGYEMLKGIIEPASAFEDAQVGLRMVTNDSAEALKQFQDQAEELSIKFPKSAEDITTAQENMYKKLGDVGATLKATEIATQLATALRVDATTGSNILGSAFENLKIKGKDTNESLEKLSDNLALLRAGFLKSDAPVGNMERDLRQLGQVAGKTHVDVDQLFTVWAELSKLGQGGRAGAAIVVKGIIDKLTESNKEGTNELARYGLHIQRTKEKHLDLIATLQQIANLPSAQRSALVNQMKGQNDALGLLVQNMGDMHAVLARFNADEGEAAKDAQKVNDTTSAAFKRLGDAATNLRVALGVGTKGQIDGITKALTEMTTALTGLTNAHPAIAKIGTDLAMAAAGLVTFAGIMGAGKMFLPFMRLSWAASGIPALIDMLYSARIALFLLSGWDAASLVSSIGSVVAALGPLIAALTAVGALGGWLGGNFGAGHQAGPGPNATEVEPWMLKIPGYRNFANADAATMISAHSGDVHYSPSITVNVNGSSDAQGVGSAVHDVMGEHERRFMRFLRDSQHDDARRSFGDHSFAGAR